jgi:cold shock CspA family protein
VDGTVATFGHDGWGIVHGSDGFDHPFHCTGIADGTRHIDVGVNVTFSLVPGRQGRWEASGISAA